MAGERIDNLSEARRELKEHRPQTEAHVVPDISAGARPVHGVAGVGMDGIEVDIKALQDAERDLARLHDDLFEQLKSANNLADPVNDGTGPVTKPMRKAFRDRADMEGGVQAALTDYLTELVAVRTAILKTLATYEGVDHEAADRLHRQVTDLSQEVG